MKKSVLFLFVGLLAFFVSCDSSDFLEKDDAVISRISGIASKGGPIAGATVYIKDSTGQLYTGETDTEGSFDVEVPDAEGPFLLMSEEGEEGSEEHLYSITPAPGNTNVSPATNCVVAIIINSDPETTFGPDTMKNPGPMDLSAVTPEKLAEAKEKVKDVLKNVVGEDDDNYDLLDDEDFDPVSSDCPADGTGLDEVLEDVDLDVSPDGEGIDLNVQVGEVQCVVDPDNVDDTDFTDVQDEYADAQQDTAEAEIINLYITDDSSSNNIGRLAVDLNITVSKNSITQCVVQIRGREGNSSIDSFVNEVGPVPVTLEDGSFALTIETFIMPESGYTYTAHLFLLGPIGESPYPEAFDVYTDSSYYEPVQGYYIINGGYVRYYFNEGHVFDYDTLLNPTVTKTEIPVVTYTQPVTL